MKILRFRHILTLILPLFQLCSTLSAEPVAVTSGKLENALVLSRGKWNTTPARTLASVDGFSPVEEIRLSKYGGLLDRKVSATGFFHAKKVDGRWWLVDPEGCLFISIGLCSVSIGKTDITKTHLKSEENWAKVTSKQLRLQHFNTLGCWSSGDSFQGENRIPYTLRWNFMSTFGKQLKVTKKAFGHTGFKSECMPIFYPGFEEFCNEHAKQLAETKDDPWLLGHFSDNELPFRPNILDLFLALSKEDPGYKAAKAWWDEYRRKTGTPDREKRRQDDQDAFLEYVANRYYGIVGNAIRKYDPNHMFIGSRVHGRCIRPATFRGSRDVDVVSVNYYHNWTPEPERIASWAEAAGRPVLMSEWYAMELPTGDKSVSGAGFRVRTEHGRGLFYQNYTLGLLEHPDCVGWHWFKYSGDDDVKCIGTVDRDYQPHQELLDMMGELNKQAYPLIDFFDARNR